MILTKPLFNRIFDSMNQTIENIIALRKKFGYSQLDISIEFNTTQNAISRIENGSRKIEIEFMQMLSRLFDMPIDSIINYHKYNEQVLQEQQAECHNKFTLDKECIQLRKELDIYVKLTNSQEKNIQNLEKELEETKKKLEQYKEQ